ncbi:MAG: hypothetical protein RL885_05730 [Planctomycetota bacterium]
MRTSGPIRRRGKRAELGTSLIELLMALALLSVGVLSHASLSLTNQRQCRANLEHRLAWEGLKSQVARLRSWPLTDCFAAFDGSLDNDPAGAPGSEFAIAGLQPSETAFGSEVGVVEWPTLQDAEGRFVIREDLDDADFGLPADLDGDGVIDSEPKDATYRRIPVRVVARWHGVYGEQSLSMTTWLGDLQ